LEDILFLRKWFKENNDTSGFLYLTDNIINMESPEAELKRIEDLREDLSAIIVIKEEKGHSGMRAKRRDRITYADVDPWEEPEYEEGWIVDEPAITEPDYPKRQTAEQALQQIYSTSEWYSARYSAGIALEFPDGRYYRGKSKVDSEVELWFVELNNKLGSQELETRSKAIKDLIYFNRISHTNDFPCYSLRKLLTKAYKTNSDKSMNKEIGKELDYSNLRIWLHNLSR
jgi:hypothetical protein